MIPSSVQQSQRRLFPLSPFLIVLFRQREQGSFLLYPAQQKHHGNLPPLPRYNLVDILTFASCAYILESRPHGSIAITYMGY